MTAYYNENDKRAAAWLRELIAHNLIAPGDVDERSIVDVVPSDLRGYAQHHFFAGIGGWSLACRLAGIPDDFRIATASLPCQPFSAAGLGRGEADERHLWPVFARLVDECRFPILTGEQVASPDGRRWFAGVRADLEGMAYGVGAADLCAAGVAAPHIRQRIYWLAYANGGDAGAERQQRGGQHGQLAQDGSTGERDQSDCADDRLDDTERARLEGHTGHGNDGDEPGRNGTHPAGPASATGRAMLWDEFDLAYLRDGTARRIEPGSFPLAHGVPARVGRLRGYGNAIVPQLAATFLTAALESIP
jgi:DNA (cytosine-5)-methyltransferase 1